MTEFKAPQALPEPHAVARLRSVRLARSSKPFLARGGSRLAHCAGCRLVLSHCLCALRPEVPTQAGVCFYHLLHRAIETQHHRLADCRLGA